MSHFTFEKFLPLFRVARHTATAMLLFIPAQLAVFVLSPPPDSIRGFFALYEVHPLLGLLSLDFLYLFSNLFLVVIYLAIFVMLYTEKPVAASLGLATGLVGVACYYPSNPAFEMLTLSKLYAQALPGQELVYLAAGESLMAGYTGTSFNAYYVLSGLCLLLYARGLLQSSGFRKSLGAWGLASGILMIVPSSAGVIGMLFSIASLIPWMMFVWLLRIEFGKSLQ